MWKYYNLLEISFVFCHAVAGYGVIGPKLLLKGQKRTNKSSSY